MQNSKITVFVISQQFLLRQGIEHSLSSAQDIEVTGAAEINDDILAKVEDLSPDVAILDMDGTADSGLTLARKIKQRAPSIGMVFMTANSGDAQLFQALKAQASGFLNKEVTEEQLVSTVRRVASGEHPINESLTSRPKVAEQVLHQFQELSWRSEAEAFMSPLTQRETGILSYIAQGYLNKQIATELGISEQTIKNHVTSILRKLNANARTEAVVIGIKQGLISIG